MLAERDPQKKKRQQKNYIEKVDIDVRYFKHAMKLIRIRHKVS